MKSETQVLWKEKFALTINEASAYFNIGSNKLREMVKEPDCNFVLYIGKKTLIKRQRLEEYLSNLEYL